MACRGAAWWVGGKVLIGWLFVSEREAQTQLSRNHKRNKPAESPSGPWFLFHMPPIA
jgi:hypothetical protein